MYRIAAMPYQQSPVARCAQIIFESFLKYNKRFQRITARAQERFEQRDWAGQIADIADRVELYETWVQKVDRELRSELSNQILEHDFWKSVRAYYGSRLDQVPDAGFMKTFFNSITRRLFGTIGIDPEVEFVAPPPNEGLATLESLSMRRYPCWGDVRATFRKVLRNFRFQVGYVDAERDVDFLTDQVQAYARQHLHKGDACLRFEFIDSHFFQGARAYLVGRILHPHKKISPIVIALRNDPEGVAVDAVLMDEREVGTVFSYTRSYYFTDPTSVVAAVQFLHSILPSKPLDELYTVLGRLRQGKTERFRLFQDHLDRSRDLFRHAAGDPGLVMIVFTLPSFNLVFKIIRDRFGYPKTSTREQVEEKYHLVSRHDHAGRLIDTQRFRNLKLPKARFQKALLEDLLANAADSVKVVGDQLVLNHAYVERRVWPLNLYVREVDDESARQAILDYGQAIRDLAETNIFPGDLLLKNFGVTTSGRVVFYDYDEVALVTECRFRELPEPDDDLDLMDPGMTAYYGPNDIFPEEFIKFLAMDTDLRKLFVQVHGDLLTADYWRDVRNRRLRGEITQVVPYARQTFSA